MLRSTTFIKSVHTATFVVLSGVLALFLCKVIVEKEDYLLDANAYL